MKKTAQKLLVGTVGAAGVLLASSTAANADSTTTHKVKQNETVWALSKKYGVSIQSIEKLNRINSNHLIITGQTLQIPSKDGSQTVNKNDNNLLIPSRVVIHYGELPKIITFLLMSCYL